MGKLEAPVIYADWYFLRPWKISWWSNESCGKSGKTQFEKPSKTGEHDQALESYNRSKRMGFAAASTGYGVNYIYRLKPSFCWNILSPSNNARNGLLEARNTTEYILTNHDFCSRVISINPKLLWWILALVGASLEPAEPIRLLVIIWIIQTSWV